MGSQVKKITIVTQQELITYTIGQKIENREIAEIEDISLEYDNSYVSLFIIKDKKGKLLKSIENCPIDVTYLF